MDFKEIGCEDGSCKDSAQDRVQWRYGAFWFCLSFWVLSHKELAN